MAKPTRRRFTAAYKLRIPEETDGCSEPGEVGRIVRREGLYSSHLTAWRKARREGSLKGLTPKRRGRKPTRRNPLQKRVDELEAEVVWLHKQLATAETILEAQGKVAGLLGLSFDSGKNSWRMPMSASTVCVVCFGIWDSPSGYEEAITYSAGKASPRESICNATTAMRNPIRCGRSVE